MVCKMSSYTRRVSDGERIGDVIVKYSLSDSFKEQQLRLKSKPADILANRFKMRGWLCRLWQLTVRGSFFNEAVVTVPASDTCTFEISFSGIRS